MWLRVKIRKLLSTVIYDDVTERQHSHNASTIVQWYTRASPVIIVIKGNNKITELRTILQRESQNS
jgi:hypothetical protein